MDEPRDATDQLNATAPALLAAVQEIVEILWQQIESRDDRVRWGPDEERIMEQITRLTALIRDAKGG